MYMYTGRVCMSCGMRTTLHYWWLNYICSSSYRLESGFITAYLSSSFMQFNGLRNYYIQMPTTVMLTFLIYMCSVHVSVQKWFVEFPCSWWCFCNHRQDDSLLYYYLITKWSRWIPFVDPWLWPRESIHTLSPWLLLHPRFPSLLQKLVASYIQCSMALSITYIISEGFCLHWSGVVNLSFTCWTM